MTEDGVEVTIDYRAPALRETEADRAKELYDQGFMNCQIAATLGCGRNWVTKLIRYWFESRGMEMPDGRKRRASLPKKQVGPTMYQELADSAKRMWDDGLAD